MKLMTDAPPEQVVERLAARLGGSSSRRDFLVKARKSLRLSPLRLSSIC